MRGYEKILYGESSHAKFVRKPTALACCAITMKCIASYKLLKENVMSTIIYIVGLIVVIGFLLSFFGLR